MRARQAAMRRAGAALVIAAAVALPSDRRGDVATQVARDLLPRVQTFRVGHACHSYSIVGKRRFATNCHRLPIAGLSGERVVYLRAENSSTHLQSRGPPMPTAHFSGAKTLVVAVAAVIALARPAAAQTWTAAAPLPSPSTGPVSGVIDG